MLKKVDVVKRLLCDLVIFGPHQIGFEVSSFGTDANYVSGKGVSCTDKQLAAGAHLNVFKEMENTAGDCLEMPNKGLCFISTTIITIDASESCTSNLTYEERYEKEIDQT